MKGGTVLSYTGTAVKTETIPGKPSQKTLPQLWPHLPLAPQPPKPTPYFQLLEPVTALSPLCVRTNPPRLSALVGTFPFITETCFEHPLP